RQPRLIDAAAPIDAVLDMLLADRAEDDAFVVIEDGAPCGASDLRGLVKRLSAQDLPQDRDIRETMCAVSDPSRIKRAPPDQPRPLTFSAGDQFRTHVEGVIAMSELLMRPPLG